MVTALHWLKADRYRSDTPAQDSMRTLDGALSPTQNSDKTRRRLMGSDFREVFIVHFPSCYVSQLDQIWSVG